MSAEAGSSRILLPTRCADQRFSSAAGAAIPDRASDGSGLKYIARGARRYFFWHLSGRTDRKLVDDYLNQAPVRKLHIGCGSNVIPGWLNADYFPRSRNILHLDATKPFSLLGSDIFDYVFSEHMIEPAFTG